MYLDPVPKAVANTWPIFEMDRYGSFRKTKKKSIGMVPNPWINKPIKTVTKYIPN